MNFPSNLVEALKRALEQQGYANDEQHFNLGNGSFGSYAFEHRKKEIIDDLRSIGYKKELESCGKFYDAHGAVYWFYDPEIIAYEDAVKRTDYWVDENIVFDK
ncbi:hypothetical protein [Zavarzinia sp.]|uniref:hypothetical protein n=1 Tax=Zavarzinia sp. TaxID=2027920 RepID=UPI003BB6CFA4